MINTKKLVLLLALALPLSGFAQYFSRADSLEKLYSTAKEDTNKVKLINNLINAYLYSDAEKALGYINEGLALSHQLNFQRGLNLFYYQKGNYYYSYNQPDSATMAYKKAYDVALSLGLKNNQARAMSGIGVVALERGDLDEAEQYFRDCLVLMEQTKDSLSIGVTLNHLGNIYQKRGHLHIALDYLTQSLRVLFHQPEVFRVADAYLALGDIERALEHHKEALEHYQLALEIYERENDPLYAGYAKAGIGATQTDLGNYEEAEKTLQSVLTFAKAEDNTELQRTALMALSEVYLNTKQFNEVIRLAKQIIPEAKENKISTYVAQANNHLALAHLENKQFSQVFPAVNESIAYARQMGSEDLLKDNYLIRSKAYKGTGNLKAALEDFEQHKALSDSLFNKTKSQQIEELRLQFDSENKEREIETLNLEIERSDLRKSLFAGGMISAMLIAGLLYFGFRQRSKRNKAEYEKEKALMAKELEFKKKELVSQTLHLVNKNTLIQDLQNDLKELRKTAGESTKQIGKIIKTLQQENASDANWEVFKSHFAQVHNDFDIKLKELAADVTDNEIRLAAFLKMKLSTKEIAAMLNVQPDSITKSKYRLKKKFNLEADDDFNAFLEGV